MRKALLYFLLSAASAAHASVTVVQSLPGNATTAATSKAVTLPGVAAGNTIVVVWGSDTAGNFTNCSDPSGTYSLVAPTSFKQGTNIRAGIVYKTNVSAGSTTVTCTFSAASKIAMVVAELSGVDTANPVDLGSASNSGSGTAITCGTTGTSNTINEYSVAAAVNASVGTMSTTATGYNLVNSASASGSPNAGFVGGAFSGTFRTFTPTATTSNSANWACFQASFRAAIATPTSTANIFPPIANIVDDATVGTVAWTNPGNAATSNDTRASAATGASKISHYLKATNFNLALPANATAVTGVKATLERNGSATTCTDSTLKLVVGGAITGNNRSFPDGSATARTWNGTTDRNDVVGGSNDTWGLTLTPAQVNASNFGIALSGANTAACTLNVDSISLAVSYAPLSITAITPGAVNQSVTITGANFGTVSNTTVTFSGAAAVAPSNVASSTSMTVTIPSTAVSGNVTVTVAGVSSPVFSYSILPTPTISANPSAAGALQSMTFNGTNYGTTANTTVTFTGANAVAPQAGITSTSLNVTVPGNATTGNCFVTVNGISSSPRTCTILPTPTIAAPPSSASVGQTMTFTGTNFGNVSNTTVTFNGAAAVAAATVPSSTTLTVTVPNNATSGNCFVTVNGVPSSPSTCTIVLSPTISSLSPPSGAGVGQSITLTGTNFGTISNTTVTFPGVATPQTPTSVPTSTTLSATVPSGATFGNLVVTVSGLVSNPISFSAIPSTTYSYDPLGRLAGVADSAGNAALYNYDAVGNILSISRVNANQISVLNFAPTSGNVGINVTIFGTGFSTTPNQNNVLFHGVAATVVSSTYNQIIATVPPLATTGIITVSSPLGSANSSSNFTLTSSTAPTITSLTPAIALTGDVVTIAGSNFDSALANDKVKVNLTNSTTTAATSSSVSTAVPAVTGSGRVAVSTPNGTALSSQDLFIPVRNHPVADVLFTGRTTIGGVNAVAVNGTAGVSKLGLLVFDANAGQRVSVSITNGTYTGCNLFLYDPFGVEEATVGCPGSTGFMDAQTTATTGTYSLALEAFNNGTATLQVNNSSDIVSTIMPGGSPVTATISTPGQNVRLNFNGVAGQRIAWTSTTSTSLSAYVKLIRPDGGTQTFIGIGGFLDTTTLTQTGQYSVYVDGIGSTTGSTTIQLYDVPPDVTARLTSGQSSQVGTASVGQGISLTYSGITGHHVTLNISSSTYSSCGLIAYNPSNQQIASGGCATGASYIDLGILPVTGDYVFYLKPNGTSIGNLSILVGDSVDLAGTIVPDGPPVTMTTTVPGQDIRLTFNGTAGQRVSLLATNSALGAYVKLMDPNNGQITYMGSMGFTDVQTLSTTGTYTVFVDTYNSTVGSITLTLYNVPVDPTATIMIGGSAVVTTVSPGQNANLTFSGTQNQHLSLDLSNGNYTSCNLTVWAPSSNYLTSGSCGGTSYFIDFPILTVTGTYTVVFNPSGTSTGSVTATLHDATDVTGPILANGTPFSFTTTVPGQNIIASFSGTAGQRVSLNTSGTSGLISTYVYLNKPGGGNLTYLGLGNYMDVQTLPTTGTYTILVDPYANSVGTATLTLWDVPADPSLSDTIGDAGVSLTTTTPGQNASVSFSATAGQTVTVHITANTMGYVTATLIGPSPATTLQTNTAGSTATLTLPQKTLSSAGTYTVTIDPNSMNVGSMTVNITSP